MNIVLASLSHYWPDLKGGEHTALHWLMNRFRTDGASVNAFCYRNPTYGVQSENIGTSEMLKIASHLDKELHTLKVSENYHIHRYAHGNMQLFEDLELCFSKKAGQIFIGVDGTGNLSDQVALWEYVDRINKKNFVIFCSCNWPQARSEAQRIKKLKNFRFFCNSLYVQRVFRENFNLELPVLSPFIDRAQYLIPEHQPPLEGFHTFVNPIGIKGAALVYEMARSLPEEKFLILIGGWGGAYVEETKYWLKKFSSLTNVALGKFREDIRDIISMTKVLLVPSQVNETFGRVVTEFQLNAVPVIASDKGNLPYTVGEGGLIVSESETASYVRAIEAFKEPTFWETKSRLARAHAMKAEFSAEENYQSFRQAISL